LFSFDSNILLVFIDDYVYLDIYMITVYYLYNLSVVYAYNLMQFSMYDSVVTLKVEQSENSTC